MDGTPMLGLLTAALVAACLSGCLVSIRRAPAVSLALFGCLAAGVAAFVVASKDGVRGVPQDTAVGATWGLLAVGLVGLAVTRGRPPWRTLRRSSIVVAAIAPAATALFAAFVVTACPLYVTGRTYCHYDFDLLGGWASGVSILFLIDLLTIAAILWVSAIQARRSEAATASAPPTR